VRIGWPGVGLAALALFACRAAPPSVGESVQDDAHPPQPWRQLTASEQATFDLGYAVFNTNFVPANRPAGRIDGLGPLFNSPSCDSCHNSRRRGRGPVSNGEAPSDLVIQLGTLLPDGTVKRGTDEYGYILNTAAIKGFKPEARVTIRYQERVRVLGDGTQVKLRAPLYEIDDLSGPVLPQATVLMPRLPPLAQGDGLLERVPRSELAHIAAEQSRGRAGIRGRVSELRVGQTATVGRFGWQASEPSVASQVGNAFAREMGLTNPVVGRIDCGSQDLACQSAPTGGTPEVQPELFEAVLAFQRLHAVPVRRLADPSSHGGRLFVRIGCAECHQPSLRVEIDGESGALIHPYTDLLLHDGRARTIEEAILWHAGEGRAASDGYARLPAGQRRALVSWVEGL
jgi:CxxC motif-containing protein (DUF1111 family)